MLLRFLKGGVGGIVGHADRGTCGYEGHHCRAVAMGSGFDRGCGASSVPGVGIRAFGEQQLHHLGGASSSRKVQGSDLI